MPSQTSSYPIPSREASNDATVTRLAQQDIVPWYKKPNLRLLYILMFPTCISVQMTNGFDASMLNGLQAVPSWLEYYHHPHSDWLGLMSAVYPLGGIVAVPFVPSIVDKFGRRYSILIGSTTMLIGGVLQGAAVNFVMFIVARFIIGLGAVFAAVAASSLVGELSHPKERAIMSSVFNTGYMVGSFSAAAVTFGTFAIPNNWGWRIPCFLEAVPNLLQLSFIWFIPESPRWLVSKGRGDEAYAILVKYHAEDDENSEFVKAEYAQIKQTIGEELKSTQMGWVEALSTPGMRKRIVIASFLGLSSKWSGIALVLYLLSSILDGIGIHGNRTKNVINLVYAGWNLVNAAFLAVIVPQYTRRGMFLAGTISLLVVFIAWTAASAEYALTHSSIASQLVLVFIFLYSPAYNVAYTSLPYTFLTELFPFHIRARGITTFQWGNRMAAFVTQFVDPIGISVAGWRYYLIYCVWNAFQVVFVYVMFPETSGRTLEELSYLYEDDQLQEGPETESLLPERQETYDSVGNNTREAGHARQRRGGRV